MDKQSLLIEFLDKHTNDIDIDIMDIDQTAPIYLQYKHIKKVALIGSFTRLLLALTAVYNTVTLYRYHGKWHFIGQ